MEIRWYQLLFQVINFGLLIFVLNRFLYRPILKIVEQRNKKIEDSIRAAEATLKEKEKIAEIKKQVVAEAEKEIAHWFQPTELISYRLVQEQILYDVNLDGILE